MTFFFSKGLTHAFGQKILFFLYFDLIKIRLGIMLSDLQEKKKPFLALKKTVRIFESPKNRIFSKGLTHALGQKMPIFL